MGFLRGGTMLLSLGTKFIFCAPPTYTNALVGLGWSPYSRFSIYPFNNLYIYIYLLEYRWIEIDQFNNLFIKYIC